MKPFRPKRKKRGEKAKTATNPSPHLKGKWLWRIHVGSVCLLPVLTRLLWDDDLGASGMY